MNRYTSGCRCCPPPNPCGCTWPRVLSYAGTVTQAQASLYFANASNASPEILHTLTYGARPADIPRQLELFYFSAPGGVSSPWYVTMPADAWWSEPVPGTNFGNATTIYFYMWMQSCSANVMVVDAPYGVGTPAPAGTKGAGNNVISYTQTACSPEFQMKDNVFGPKKIYGAHAGDDLVPDATASAGAFNNGRNGLAYGLHLFLPTLPTAGHPRTASAVGYTPDYPVTWSSSDTSVFTVTPAVTSNGQATVTRVASGTADLTATCSDPDCSPQTATLSVTLP